MVVVVVVVVIVVKNSRSSRGSSRSSGFSTGRYKGDQRRPKDQKTEGPGDQRGPKDQRTRGPKDQGTLSRLLLFYTVFSFLNHVLFYFWSCSYFCRSWCPRSRCWATWKHIKAQKEKQPKRIKRKELLLKIGIWDSGPLNHIQQEWGS